MTVLISKIILKILKKGTLKLLFSHKAVKKSNQLKIGNYNTFTIHENAFEVILGKLEIRNYCNILVHNNAKLIINNNFFMNNYCSINCLDKIEIGENTLFGEGVKLYDHNHKYSSSPNFRIEAREFNTAPIKIGKNCWLGSNVTVLKGVTIGDNCIIGAGCIIYKDIPANSMIINKQEVLEKDL
ncbi:acyltransferase [Chishuiella sp.]|uniref:acyltransferase n=1 Tax=Chishuiella sp. TaxID=1969467 RepID=UPI0028AA5AB3|nr:acyltransferase [Chishuiella sp.]